jgi:hypothetical protein
MKIGTKLLVAATLSFLTGIAFASPLLYTNLNIKPFPRVSEGPKAQFSVDVVYASFNPVGNQYTTTEYGETGAPKNTTYPATSVTYNVVLNVTNLSDQPATIYELAFTAAQNISVKQSILGGTIYDNGFQPENSFLASKHFGGIVDGVYLDDKWVNVTWIPNGYYEANGTWISVPYPECLFALTQAYWHEGVISGPLTPDDLRIFSADHTVNGTIPDLPDNASDTGIWFEGVPIAEYYSLTGTPLVTEMYINGSWVDVTGRVTVDKTQPMMTASNMLVNDVLTLGAQPYANMNSTIGPITALPTWGDWGTGRAYSWLPWDWQSKSFNNTWAPHESRLIMFNNTQMFLFSLGDSRAGLDALQTGKIALYASASNYINNWPVNGTYYNTVSTATCSKQIQLQKTATGSYLYNAVLADGETFQPTQSGIEVTITPGT